MPDHLHAVTITGDREFPRIEFRCSGDESAACHTYSRCTCIFYDPDHRPPATQHADCWMASWFDSDGTEPSSWSATATSLEPGMSGPIQAHLAPGLFGSILEWQFVTAEETADA